MSIKKECLASCLMDCKLAHLRAGLECLGGGVTNRTIGFTLPVIRFLIHITLVRM
jgi:hypothetical protein